MDINYQPSTDPWLLRASSPLGELTFSGVFELSRVRIEASQRAIHRAVIGICIAFGVIGLVALVFSAQSISASRTLWFLLVPSFFNAVFWLSTIADLYLWATFIERQRHKRTRAEILKGKNKNSTIDVYELFNPAATQVWNKALTLAGGSPVTMHHVLDALLEDKEIQIAFYRLSLGTKTVAAQLHNVGQADPQVLLRLPFEALAQATSLRSMEITPLVLLVGLLAQLPVDHEITKNLDNLGADSETLQMVARWMTTVDALSAEQKQFSRLASFKPDNEINIGLTSVPTPYLDQFSQDLTMQAKYGHLPLAVGREEDIEKLFAILDEGKPQVLLIGDIGTGRTTLINDVAHRMATETVPRLLQDKRLVALQLASIAGSRVAAEKVLIEALAEAEKSGNIVLVMEDLHLLAKMESSQGLSILEVLLNHLQSSPLVVLATTTENDYQSFLHNALNFEALFTTYELHPLSEEAITMAACVKASLLEGQYKVFFTYDAIKQAVKLSDQYFQDMGQPQKTVGVLSEVATKLSGGKNMVITAEAIAQYISEKTHVPATVVGADEADKLMNLEQELGKFVIGQIEAVKAVSAALRRARSGLDSTKQRPIASFLFVGPTGVGKTELAKTLAQVYFGDPKFLLRLDMSEYRGSDGLQKLLGSPDDNNNSVFVNHLKNYPFCLFLLDEFEKASPEVLNLFLQILEDGRLTTGKGETLNLTHTIIIATSNAGTAEIQAGLKSGTTLAQIKATLFESVLMKHYAPELLNRFDGVILFTPLSQVEVEQIARLQLVSLASQLDKEKGITFTYTDSAVSFIATHGYDQALGARPIRRFIQDSVENLLADALLTKRPGRGTTLSLDVTGESLTLT